MEDGGWRRANKLLEKRKIKKSLLNIGPYEHIWASSSDKIWAGPTSDLCSTQEKNYILYL
jgi:hypothetical protein